MLRRFVGTVNLHQLNGVAGSDLHDIAGFRIGKRCSEFARKGRERHDAHLAAVGGGSVINRILRSDLSEIGTALEHGQQTVGQRLLRIGKYDVADAHRVGNDLGIQRAGHRPLVVLQYGTVGGAVEQGLGLLFRKLLRRDVVVGDFAIAVGADKRLQLFGGGELRADLGDALFERQHVVVGRRNLEHDIRKRTRRRLLEHVLVAVVIRLDVARLELNQRIGNGRVFLTGPLAGIGVVGGVHTVGHFERIDIHTALDQAEELGDLALHAGLLVELRPSLLRLRVGFGLGEELVNGGDVVLTRAGIREGIVESLRRMLAADHRHTFRLGNAKAHLVESGSQHVFADQGLPCSVGKHRRLLFVALLSTALRLDLLVLVVILRIVDLFTVDNTDPGVVA